MYSELKNVQMLLSLLKEYGVRKCVLSSGTTSVPILHSMEQDNYFECYSVVDERSAAYFAMGISQESNEPVAIVCTSGTACCNYLPGVTEAYYQNVPLIVITCDKRPYELNQHILQKINQSNMFGDKTVFSTDIPFVEKNDSERFCIDKINEALIYSCIKKSGPVHINVYTGGNRTFSCESLPKVRKIEYFETPVSNDAYKTNYLENKKILLIVGQQYGFGEEDLRAISSFANEYDVAVEYDYMANIQSDYGIMPYRVLESMGKGYFEDNLIPDIVISMGGNILSGKLNDFLLRSSADFEHWFIGKDTGIVDPWGHLTRWYDCTFSEFYSCFKRPDISLSHGYYKKWLDILTDTPIPRTEEFNNLFIAKCMVDRIPDDSIVHLGILNSTRVMQFWETNKKIKVYSNIGALGIDGSMSTFLGQASSTSKECFLLIGDLSFFYDIGSLNIRYLGKNVHIILLNNGGGGEFYFNIGSKAIPCLDDYIAAAHDRKAEKWVCDIGFVYYSAHNITEFENAFSLMLKYDGESPQIIEAFTDKEFDAASIHSYYDDVKHLNGYEKGKNVIKNFANILKN